MVRIKLERIRKVEHTITGSRKGQRSRDQPFVSRHRFFVLRPAVLVGAVGKATAHISLCEIVQGPHLDAYPAASAVQERLLLDLNMGDFSAL